MDIILLDVRKYKAIQLSAMCMDLENILLSEISQRERNRLRTIFFTCGI